MCTAAIYWAGVDKCYYAATVEDIGRFELPGSTGAAASSYEATVFHNREDMLPAEQRQQVPFINMMRNEGAAVFEKYSQLPESEKANADC
jgi:tRNA(Arg) A34 adenosine deaminase TadA